MPLVDAVNTSIFLPIELLNSDPSMASSYTNHDASYAYIQSALVEACGNQALVDFDNPEAIFIFSLWNRKDRETAHRHEEIGFSPAFAFRICQKASQQGGSVMH